MAVATYVHIYMLRTIVATYVPTYILYTYHVHSCKAIVVSRAMQLSG